MNSTVMSLAMITVVKANDTIVCPVTMPRTAVVVNDPSDVEKVVCTWTARER